MGDEAAHLHGIAEVLRRGVTPVGKRLLRRQVIEAVVEFDCAEGSGIELQPLRLGEVSGVEPPPPVFVVPATGAYIEFWCHLDPFRRGEVPSPWAPF